MSIFVIDKFKPKNSGTFKLMDANDINWDGFNFNITNLPKATTTTYGIVQIGTGLSVADGVISTTPLTAETIDAALGYTPADDKAVEKTANKGKANGYVGLTKDTKIDPVYLPAIDAATLNGHDSSYFATENDFKTKTTDLDNKITNFVNGLQWKPSVADKDALKALAAPKEGWTVSLNDANTIYRFDDANTATEDSKDISVLIPNDKTKGAWVLLGTTIYSLATEDTDGLMSKGDKKILDDINKTLIPGLRTDITTLQGYFDKDGKALKAEDSDKLGGVAAADYAKMADVTAKFVAKVAGKDLSTNDFTNDEKTKLDGLTNYVLPTATAKVLGGVKIGTGISITSDGVISAATVDLSEYAKKVDVATKPAHITFDVNTWEADGDYKKVSITIPDGATVLSVERTDDGTVYYEAYCDFDISGTSCIVHSSDAFKGYIVVIS